MLLSNQDPNPVEIVEAVDLQHDYSAPGLLLCEHAGQCVPQELNQLGLADDVLQQHIAYDIGAEATARLIAKTLRVPLLLQRYSRLVIDCNRPTQAPDSIPAISDGTSVTGNQCLSETQRAERKDEIFTPFDIAIENQFNQRQYRWAFSIHSFTPAMNGEARPWDIGFLFRQDTDTSARMRAKAHEVYPDLHIGMNQPYQIDDESDWFIPRHAEPRNLAHSLIEIRNDHIRTSAGQQKWAAIVSTLIRHAVFPE